jgi:hypothetical protein
MFSKKSLKFPVRITEKLKNHAGCFKTFEFEIPIDQLKIKLVNDGVIEIVLPDRNVTI